MLLQGERGHSLTYGSCSMGAGRCSGAGGEGGAVSCCGAHGLNWELQEAVTQLWGVGEGVT